MTTSSTLSMARYKRSCLELGARGSSVPFLHHEGLIQSSHGTRIEEEWDLGSWSRRVSITRVDKFHATVAVIHLSFQGANFFALCFNLFEHGLFGSAAVHQEESSGVFAGQPLGDGSCRGESHREENAPVRHVRLV